MKKTYVFKHDPGHGWLLVPYADIAELGIKDKITSYSYLLKGHVWLEEDCDAATFLDAAKDKGWDVQIGSDYIPYFSRDHQPYYAGAIK